MARRCKNCTNWTFADWSPPPRSVCLLKHDTPDYGDTNADDCPDYDGADDDGDEGEDER